MRHHTRAQSLSPKEEVKKRLKMVLVADRCGMSPASLAEMKKTIVKALQVCLRRQLRRTAEACAHGAVCACLTLCGHT